MNDNFEFDLVDLFAAYNSARDKTKLAKNFLVRGSKNVYFKQSGTVAPREGIKKRGSSDPTISGIKSENVWETSLGATKPLRVVGVTDAGGDGKLQVESDIVTPGTYVWYNLMTGLSLTRFVFDTWWDNTEKKDRLLFVKGDTNMHHWSGGIALLASATAGTSTDTVGMKGNNVLLTSLSITQTQAGTALKNQVNGAIGTAAAANFYMTSLPSTGEKYTVTVNGTPIDITFVSAIGVTAGNVLIEATVALTMANLAGLLQSPGTTTAKHVALSAGNQTLIGYFTSALAGTITLAGTSTWAQRGFYTNTLAEKRFTIGSQIYLYTGGENTTTLTGVTPDPSALAVNSVVIQSVITEANTPAAGFNCDFIKTIGNRVHCGSYTSRLVYISSSTDFKNYTVPTPRTPGTPELLVLDNTAKGITVRNGHAHIGAGTSDWYEVSYNAITVSATLTEQTTVDKKPVSYLSAPLAHEFIDVIGNTIIYLSQDQQVRNFGTFRNEIEAKYPTLSQAVKDEFKQEDFTGGHLRCIGEFIHVTAPVNGRDWMHETRESINEQGGIDSIRFWHPPQIRNISRFSVISGVTYGHSNSNPMIYQIWDTNQWSDDSSGTEQVPYTAIMRMSYRNFKDRRWGLLKFDKSFFEGYIAAGVKLYSNIYSGYQGSQNFQQVVINSVDNPATFLTGNQPPSLGTSDLGDNPLGDGIVVDASGQDLLPKFYAIRPVTSKDCIEYDIEIFSYDLDCRWEMLSFGLNPILSPSYPTYMQKKTLGN